jgi:TonB family protein
MVRPVLLAKIEPVYPTTARIARMAGRVVVEAVIGLDGRVESAEVISSTSPVRRLRPMPGSWEGPDGWASRRVYFKVAVESSSGSTERTVPSRYRIR